MINLQTILDKYKRLIDANTALIDKYSSEIITLTNTYNELSVRLDGLTKIGNTNQGNSYGSAYTGFEIKDQQLTVSIQISQKQDAIDILRSENSRLENDKNLEIAQANTYNEKEFNEQHLYTQRFKTAIINAKPGGTPFTKEDKRYLFLVFMQIVIIGLFTYVAIKILK